MRIYLFYFLPFKGLNFYIITRAKQQAFFKATKRELVLTAHMVLITFALINKVKNKFTLKEKVLIILK